MENFYNYISKVVPSDEVDIWLKINNIIPEKMELFSDFSQSLYDLMRMTYLGESTNSYETKITLTEEDNKKHFEWCWVKIIDNFQKENIVFYKKGEHFDYFQSFFDEIFYNLSLKRLSDEDHIKICKKQIIGCMSYSKCGLTEFKSK